MAEKRMFSKQIIDSDAFLEMPLSSQALYFHLSMRADDDGFVNNPKKIAKIINASDDDLKILLAKNFILSFDSGVIVIKHWRINNYLRKDRYNETVYLDEKDELIIKKNGAYSLLGIPNGNQMDTGGIHSIEENRIDKSSIDKISIEETPKETKKKYGEYKHVLLTEKQYNKLKEDFPKVYEEMIKNLDEYLQIKNVTYKDHNLVMRKWQNKNPIKSKDEPVWKPKDDYAR